jgi:cation-transporting ATPase 13A1
MADYCVLRLGVWKNRRTKEINLDAEFEPSLLNSAIYLLSTCQSVSTFAVNFQGRPFREDIKENKPLFYGLLGAAAVAFCGATNFVPEANGWLQLVDMPTSVSVVDPWLGVLPAQFSLSNRIR